MVAPESRFFKFEALLLTTLFVILISLPLCKQWIVAEPNMEAVEGRRLHELPELSFRHELKNFPIKFETYYNDHFGFRAALLRMGAYIGVKYTNLSLSPDVIIGKEGWLFFRNGQSLENYHGGPVLSDADLEQWKRYFELRQKWLARRGIRYLLVIPPDKQSLYPEFMPDKYNHFQDQTMAQQMVGYLSTHSSIPVLSLLEPLTKAKGKDRLYYRNDTHWNTMGAFIGYREIINRLREWYPELKPTERSEFQTAMEYHSGDSARMMGIPDYSAGYEPALKPLVAPVTSNIPFKMEGMEVHELLNFTVQSPDATSKIRVVMRRDSFTILMAPYLSANFPQVTYFAVPLDELKSEKALVEGVRRDKPDVFIEEILERLLLKPPQNDKIIFGGADN